MNLISVIPIMKGLLKKELTYFSSKDLSVGYIVTVLIRKKEVRALVTKIEDLSKKKISVRASDFELKKVLGVHAKSPLDKHFVEAVRKTAEYHVLSVGATLFRLVPQEVLENNLRKKEPAPHLSLSGSHEELAFQASFEDRISFYKTYIRELFAKKESLYICLPSSRDVEVFKESLSKGVESYIFSLHGDITKKKLKETLNNIDDLDHSVVVLGTPQFLYSITDSMHTIILEHESSPIYKTFVDPLFDIRTFVRFLAKEQKNKLILADTILQTETIWETKEGSLDTLIPANFRFQEKNERVILDTKDREEGSPWSPITEELKSRIVKSIEVKERIFLFTLRKGLAPFTVCNDCKKTLTCKNCETPLTLYKQKTSGERIFVCNTCKHTAETLTTCPYCNSWNLTPLGVGTEMIEDYLKENIPEARVFVLDQNTAKTKTQAKKIIKEYESTPGAIMVATELALHHQMKEVPLVGIVSFDSLFAIPSFRIHERILHLLIHLEDMSLNSFVVQTKNIEAPILKTFKDNTFIQYYNNEITERQNFSYPPFTTLIKIIPDTRTSKEEVKKIAEKFFSQYNPNLFITTHRREKVPAILLKVPREVWNPSLIILDHNLRGALFGLPLTWTIHIDPEHT
ncbi:MAG: primosomal protein N' [Candidatus Paceibacteria bacterium]|jgi:primosomal protein N'